jgi:hypothetical protein
MSNRWIVGLFTAVLAIAVSGCYAPPPPGDLDELNVDANNNGFPEVAPPAGVTVDDVGTIMVQFRNTIAKSDLIDVAQGFEVDPALVALANVVASLNLRLNYDGGLSDELVQTETIQPFDRRIEVACPQSADISITVTANAPGITLNNVADFAFSQFEGTDYSCGETIILETFLDLDGRPQVRVSRS